MDAKQAATSMNGEVILDIHDMTTDMATDMVELDMAWKEWQEGTWNEPELTEAEYIGFCTMCNGECNPLSQCCSLCYAELFWHPTLELGVSPRIKNRVISDHDSVETEAEELKSEKKTND